MSLSRFGPRFSLEQRAHEDLTATPDDISHDWHVVDAAGVPLGRLASVVAQLIRGKHKPTYTPHMDGGDFVVVVNAAKVRLSGRKLDKKKYFCHTGYMGHERFTAARDLLAKHPERVIEKAVFGMLPKTSLAGRSSGASSRCTPAPSIRTRRSSPSRSPSLRPR